MDDMRLKELRKKNGRKVLRKTWIVTEFNVGCEHDKKDIP